MLILYPVIALVAPAYADRDFVEVEADFDGDNQVDVARGFPAADGGIGRVDIVWGAGKPTLPTVLSPLLDPGLMVGPEFGAALAAGDFDADGYDDLLVGIPGRVRDGIPETGSVLVVYGCHSTCGNVDSGGRGVPAAQAALNPYAGSTRRINGVASGPSARVRYGDALAVGDFDNDGYDDAAFGAPGRHAASGRVYVRYGGHGGLAGSSTVLSQHYVQLKEANDRFGSSLGAAQLDGLGGDELVVGVPGEDYGSDVNAGQIDVFLSGPTGRGLDAQDGFFYRNLNAVTGGFRSHDRLGQHLSITSGGFVRARLDQIANCGHDPGFLMLQYANRMLQPMAWFPNPRCSRDICDRHPSSFAGDGALPPIEIQYVVATTRNDPYVPSSTWSGTHPISGEPISGLVEYFEAMTDLINQQMVSSDHRSICYGDDCVRVETSRIVSSIDVSTCPDLAALADRSTSSQDGRRFTENCDSHEGCPVVTPPGDSPITTSSFSDFANRAFQYCVDAGGLRGDMFTLLVYDVCRVTEGDDIICGDRSSGPANGRARSGLHSTTDVRSSSLPNPYAYVDFARALLPRDNARGRNTTAPEEHEVGHALGLHHLQGCFAGQSDLPTMHDWSGNCTSPLKRVLGFQDRVITDYYGNSWNEVRRMVEVVRRHYQDVWCP